MRMRLFVILALGATTALDASAQSRPGAPPSSPPSAESGVIRGRIFAGDTGRPLRRADVSLSGGTLVRPRGTATNVDGKYEFKDVPPGQYTVSVNRSGYLPLKYGQRRPFELGKPLQIEAGQTVDRLDFSLPRMSLITGRVLDDLGEPIANVQVMAMQSTYFLGRRRLSPVSRSAQTDDAGQYRLTGLAPGSYYVLASTRETWTVNAEGKREVLGYAPTYFPGTERVADARRVSVGEAQETGGQDFLLVAAKTATISGRAFDSHGRPLSNVGLTQEFVGQSGGMFLNAGNTVVAGDGTFTLRNVPPGEYKLVGNTDPAAGGREAAAISMAVNGVDIRDVFITTSEGWSASGRVIAEGGAVPDAQRERIRIIGQAVDPDLVPRVGSDAGGQVLDDWTFAVRRLFGAARIGVNPPDGWMLKSVIHNGIDITGKPIELKSGEAMSGLEVVLSNRVASITGQLADAKGVPTGDGTVIVFSSEPSRWTEGSRFVRSARPDQYGQFRVTGLSPGDYLASAIQYVQDGMWNDPEFLESLRGSAQTVTLDEGSARTLSLRIIAP